MATHLGTNLSIYNLFFLRWAVENIILTLYSYIVCFCSEGTGRLFAAGAAVITGNDDSDEPAAPTGECYSGKAQDYRGVVNYAVDDCKIYTCQKWTEQTPNEHSRTPDNYPDAGLGDHNYCRNPDGESGGAWCYTVDGPRWAYCNIAHL